MQLSRRTVLSATAGLVLAGPARAQAPGSGQGARVPFEQLNGKIFAPVMVNGVPVQAMLDSGSAFYGVDQGFAAEAGIAADGRRTAVRGVQHTLRARYGRIATLLVAGGALTDLPALVIDYRSLSATVGHEVQMALGGDFFRQFVVDLDFASQTLALTRPDAFVAPPGADVVPLRNKNGLMTAPVTFSDETSLWSIVDTGSDPPLIVSPGPASRLKLFGKDSTTAPLGGVGGQSVVKIASAPKLALGAKWFEDVPVQGVRESLGADANLGLGLLSQFRVWLDFSRQQMWLLPRRAPRPFRRDLLGFYGVVREGAIRVTHIAPHSPAAGAGFKVGEVVTAINGVDAVRANQQFRDARAGSTLAFTLADGTTRSLTLARYY